MKSPFRQPSENEEDFDAMLSVEERANQYAAVFDVAKEIAGRYGVKPWYGASDQDLVSAATSRGCPASELKEWADARRKLV
jgi:hypothetical protein